MPVKIHIPTPLRPYTDKLDVVELDGATVSELLANLTTRFAGLKQHLFNEEGKLRSFVNVYVNDEDIRYLQKDQTPLKAGDTVSIIPSVAGGTGPLPRADKLRRRTVEGSDARAAAAVGRRSQALQPPPDPSRSRHGRAARAESGKGAVHWRGRARIAGGDVSRGRRRRHARHRRFRCRRHEQPAAAVAARHADVGRPKLDSAKDRLHALNPNVHVETYETALSSENALQLFEPYDVILDGTDNFPTRYLVNDACVLLGKPNAYGSIFRFEGQASVFGTKEGPCYRCLYPEPPPPGLVPSCAEGGVLGVLPGIIGTIQATETIKLILGKGEPLIGRFLIFDALRMKFRELKLRKDADCPVCGTHPTVTELIDYEQFCGVGPRSESDTWLNDDRRHDPARAQGASRSRRTDRRSSTCGSRRNTRSTASPGRR